MNKVSAKRGAALRVGIGVLVLLIAGLPAMCKVEVDFNPNLDFSHFKTYAYIGGVSVRHHEGFEHARRHAGTGSDRREE
jgi:hypothetical protein